MNEKQMLELADQLKSLRELKAELQADVKEVSAKIDAVEASLIEIMTAEECTGFKRGNSTFSLVIKEFPGAVPEFYNTDTFLSEFYISYVLTFT